MRIELWHNDETTDQARPWTVSLCDDFGAEEELLGTSSTYEGAKRVAEAASLRRVLPAVFRESSGLTYPL